MLCTGPVDLGKMSEYFSVEEEAWGLKTIITEYGEPDSMEGVLLGGPAKELERNGKLANQTVILQKNALHFYSFMEHRSGSTNSWSLMSFAADIKNVAGLDKSKISNGRGGASRHS